MRSSIACARCRRSKVKCVNNGIGTICRACETTGRECTYPQPSVGGGVRRSSGDARHPSDSAAPNDTPKRHRPKKTPAVGNNVSTKESMRAQVDALDTNLLTPQVWIELFEIWQLHFSTDLPFIHPPTFTKPLRQMQQTPVQAQDFSLPRQPANSLPPASPLLLLGFLALTARFHEKLVAHHSPASASRPSNPLIASQYYASACKARLAGNSGDGLGLPDIQRIQALLMLALHDWGGCQGIKAWTSAGVAMRYAQILGLQYQLDLDNEPQAHSTALALEAAQLGIGSTKGHGTSSGGSDDFIEQETRRRIFWSCFNIDRYLSSGKFRPQMLHVNDIRVQLPSSERAFLFGERVRTALLSEDADHQETRAHPESRRQSSVIQGGSNGDSTNRDAEDERNGQWETGNYEGIVSRYVKVIDLYGHIIKWSCGGGRRRERYPPWDPRSTWYSLQARVSSFTDRLPRDLTLSQANASAHMSSRTSGTPYTMLHCVLTLCKMMLHREYIPFVPLRCTKPQGPLDAPLFPPIQYNIPTGFWEESAKELFRSARDLMDLIQTCREWNALPETPIVGFAVYTVAFIGVYAINFPWMDVEGYMCNKSHRSGSDGSNSQQSQDSGAVAARNALSLIGIMRRRLKMADGWFKTIGRVHKYFVRIKRDFRRNARALAESSPEGGQLNQLSLREGGLGGGLEEYKIIEMTLKEFGSLEDDDMEMTDAPEVAESSVTSTAMKSEGYTLRERSPDSASLRPDRWNAINNAGTGVQTMEPTTNGMHSVPVTSSSATSPSGTYVHSGHSQFPPSTGTSPLVSPGAFGPGQFPPYPPTQQAPSTQQQHYQPPPPPPLPPMTTEQTEDWLQSLETSFGGDDVTAFVEGKDWPDWAAIGPLGVGGWLNTVWTGPTSG